MITNKTQARFGVRPTPHEFRHCAATSIAEFHPEDLHIIQVILGHATLDTAQQYYTRTKGIEAVLTLQTAMKRKRTELNKMVPA
jgi:integrase